MRSRIALADAYDPLSAALRAFNTGPRCNSNSLPFAISLRLSLLFISSVPPMGSSPAAATRFSQQERRGYFRKWRLDLSACHRQRSWGGRKCPRVHGKPGGVFIATGEPSNGTRQCSGREPLVPMMEPADLWKRHDLSATAGPNRSPLGGVLAQRKVRSGSVVIIEVRN